jgi:hypothetical protein
MQDWEQLEVIKARVPFFKTFYLQRRLKLIEELKKRVLEEFDKTIEELGLEDGAKLILGEVKSLSE